MGDGHENRRVSATSRGVRLWEKGRTIILALRNRPCPPSPLPPGYLAVCMLKPACIPFKYYNTQSRQGFNMAIESAPDMGEFSREDVEALTNGLQHGFNMASAWPLSPPLILGNSVPGMLNPD